MKDTTPKAPVARVEPKEMVNHGVTRVDDYYWMRDDERDDPEVLAHLEAENAYTDAVMEGTEALQKELFEEMKGRLEQDDASVPYLSRGFWYYTRFEEGKEYPIYCRKKGSMEADEQIIIDANVRAEGQSYYNLGDIDVSESGDLIAYTEDTLSRRIYTIRFKNLETGEDLPDVIEGTTGGVTWAANDTHVFYMKRDEKTLRSFQVWRHTLGTPTANDALVYQEDDETFSTYAYLSRSREYVIVASSSTLTDEARVIDVATPEATPTVFLPREVGHEYGVDHALGRFFVRTNKDALNFKLMSAPPETTADMSTWTEVVPHREDVYLSRFVTFDGHLVLHERVDGMTTLRVKPWDASKPEHTIAFDDGAYFVYPSANPDPKTTTLRFGFQSMTTPRSTYDYDMETRERTLLKQDKVLGGFDPADYVSERIMVTARDGAQVPVSLVHRKDLDRSKPAPLYQYGYGSYGASMEPYFGMSRLSLLDRGFIFAIAHIRGGQEFGRKWYDDGKMLRKMNTFNDFIDVSKHLIAKGYTAPDQLIISGGSAGGLLVGAVMNMAPELYAAVVANVPFVDVVTTMLDESIPLTTFEYDEWGNPNEKVYFDYMLSYSPYDNVEAKDYPNVLVITGLHDSQVQYWEPMKWVAKLRARKTDSNLLLFSVDMEAGHGGASGRFKRFEETALEYAFLLKVLGRAGVDDAE
jgi:oligopeptidase B